MTTRSIKRHGTLLKSATASLLAAVLLAALGCAGANLQTQPALEVEVPESWSSAAGGDRETASPDDIERAGETWWRAFGDSDLDRLIEIALAANRDLRSAGARLDAALAQARIAGAARKPELGLSTQASRARQNFIGLPIPGAEGRVLSNTSTTLGATLNVSWEADLWGRIRAGQLAAVSRAEAAADDLAAARLSIAGQTAKAWFAYLEAVNQVSLAEETLTNRTRVRERIERRYRQGLLTALDLRLAVAEEATAEALHAARKRQRSAVRRQLEVLLARDAAGLEILAAANAELPGSPPPPLPGLPSDLLRRRPDLRASELRLAAAGLDVAAARRLLYPRLTLTGSTGTRGQEPGDLLDTDFTVWSVAAGLLQPLFQGGRLRAGVELSEAARADALAQHENAVIRALSEVESRLASDRFLRDQQIAVAKALEASVAAEALARDRYFSGLSGYLSLLAAQNRATSSASQSLEIDRTRLEGRVDLYLALGGADSPSAARNVATQASAASQTEAATDPKDSR